MANELKNNEKLIEQINLNVTEIEKHEYNTLPPEGKIEARYQARVAISRVVYEQAYKIPEHLKREEEG